MSVALILLHLVVALTYVHCEHEHLVIKKDSMTLFKSGQFSVYDTIGELKYRIESSFRFRHNNYVRVHPSQEVIGRLTGKWSLWAYKADISLLDTYTNSWADGNITESGGLFENKYFINWNGHAMWMDTSSKTPHRNIYEKNSNDLLAYFKKRDTSFMTPKQYDLYIFSTKFPHTLYLFALAVYDHQKSRPRRG